ncbi:MAG: glycosyltransferase family 9 protein [Planctomycetaceae bacterium]
MRILLVRLSALGDVVCGLHALSAIQARKPEAKIGWLVEDRFASLLEGHPQLAALHVYPRRRSRGPFGWARALAFVARLRRQRYDLALDLQGNLKSGLLARLSGAQSVWGLAPPHSREGNSLLVRRRVPCAPGNRIDAYHALVDAALGPGPRPPPLLPATAAGEGVLALHPGTSRFGAHKRWPARQFAELGARLTRRLALPAIVTAGPGEEEEAQWVVDALGAQARLARPADLRALVDLLAGARLCVAADTGPAHIAAILGIPTLTLFGPKDPALMAPVGPHARALRAGVRCSPCTLRHCPDPVCMEALSVERVEREALALLGEAP